MIAALLQGAAAAVLTVSPAGPYRSVAEALDRAPAGARIVVRAGRYREPPLVVTRRVELVGEGEAVLEGGAHTTLEIRADSVLVRGFLFDRVTPSVVEERAAVRITGARGCRVEDNVLRRTHYGIYAVAAQGCVLRGNRIEGPGRTGTEGGNGIHLWRSREFLLADNIVSGHRDGIYLEFTGRSQVSGNRSEGNLRYGLHFMRSDSVEYRGNTFARNGTGVAVMYSQGVVMAGNRFERNWGPAAYGLLLKDISDGVVEENEFSGNTVGLYLEGADRNRIAGNRFTANGWAIKTLANATGNRFTGNLFLGNTFDVATNSRSAASTFEGNWWDRYRGYDLDGDGRGDVPFRPVRLFALVVEQNEPALVLLRSPFVDLLDAAERVLPVLTPEALSDTRPLMRRPR